MKKRGLRSPDLADPFLLTFACGDASSGIASRAALLLVVGSPETRPAIPVLGGVRWSQNGTRSQWRAKCTPSQTANRPPRGRRGRVTSQAIDFELAEAVEPFGLFGAL
jgi:hypothetical protein